MARNGGKQPKPNAPLPGALQAAMLASHGQLNSVKDNTQARLQSTRSTERDDSPLPTRQPRSIERPSLPRGMSEGLAAAQASVKTSAKNVNQSRSATISSSKSSKSASLAAKASVSQQLDLHNIVENPRPFVDHFPSAPNLPISRTSSSQSLAAAQSVISFSTSPATVCSDSSNPQTPAAELSVTSLVSKSNEVHPKPRIRSPLTAAACVYYLPQAVISEPVLSNYSPLESLDNSTRQLKGFKQRRHISSVSSDLPTRGAATAMTSRSSTQISLPTLSSTGDRSTTLDLPEPSPKRPVHLKTTMRNVHSLDKELGRKHHGVETLSENERKRYDGVWASNWQSSTALNSEKESRCLDRLVVRELWSRSKLSSEILRRIW